MAAAIGSGSAFLVTHSTRHSRSSTEVRVVRPGRFIEEARSWMTGFGRGS